MINKLVVDNLNITLNEKTVLPFTYVFSMAGVHQVRIGLDNTNEICAYAFKDCEDLSKVKYIPKEITMIKRNAFENCIKLTRFDMPSQIEYVGPNVFDGCNNLREINFESPNPPRFYSVLQDSTNCYIPDDSKYIPIATEDINQYYKEHNKAAFYKHRESDSFGGYGFEEVDFEALDLTENGPQYYIDNWIGVHNHYNTIEERFRIKPTSIEFEYEIYGTIDPGQEGHLPNYIIFPEETTNTNVYFYSSNNNILTVNENGDFKAADIIRRQQNVFIYVCTEPYYDNTNYSSRIRFTVKASENLEPLKEMSLEFTNSEISISEAHIGDTIPFESPTLIGGDDLIDPPIINYTSSNNTIAKFEGENLIVKGAGTVTITATYSGDNTHDSATASFTLTIELAQETPIIPEKIDPELSFNEESITITTTGELINAPVLTNTNNVTVTYSSSNTNVAIVDNTGKVTVIANGETTISATFAGNDTYNAKTVTYTLIINIPEEQEENIIEAEYISDENGDIQIINTNTIIQAEYISDENGDIQVIVDDPINLQYTSDENGDIQLINIGD